MKRFTLRMRIDLYERIFVLAKFYKLSKNEIINKLLEIGYIEYIKGGEGIEINNK